MSSSPGLTAQRQGPRHLSAVALGNITRHGRGRGRKAIKSWGFSQQTCWSVGNWHSVPRRASGRQCRTHASAFPAGAEGATAVRHQLPSAMGGSQGGRFDPLALPACGVLCQSRRWGPEKVLHQGDTGAGAGRHSKAVLLKTTRTQGLWQDSYVCVCSYMSVSSLYLCIVSISIIYTGICVCISIDLYVSIQIYTNSHISMSPSYIYIYHIYNYVSISNLYI